MIWIILMYVSLIIVFVSRGVEQGILWSRRGADSFSWNEHIVIAVSRVMIGIVSLTSVLCYLNNGLWYFFFTGMIFIPSFWWWHNTSYYLTRHLINSDVYSDWLTAESSSSTARFNMDAGWRIALGLVSLILLIILIVIV